MTVPAQHLKGENGQVRFTLHYEGPLAANGSAADKQKIREHFEPQLQELWGHPPLRFGDARSVFLQPRVATDENENGAFGFPLPRALVNAHGHTFAALVCDELGLGAELEVLMLRPAAPGQIVVGGGDIDNRLKTLFDALAAPQQAQQVQMGGRVTSEEQPMFVLLDDDNRITRVAVETDRLLSAPEASYVRLFIRVTTRVLHPSIANIELGLN